MEDGLGAKRDLKVISDYEVLILVVMEDGLGVIQEALIEHPTLS